MPMAAPMDATEGSPVDMILPSLSLVLVVPASESVDAASESLTLNRELSALSGPLSVSGRLIIAPRPQPRRPGDAKSAAPSLPDEGNIGRRR